MNTYDKFTDFQKFSYRVVCKPEQTLSQRLKNTFYLYTKSEQKSSYFKDVSFLLKCIEISPKIRIKLDRLYKLYKFSDVAIIAYGLHSLYWHYNKKFFTGSNLIEAYIVCKVFLNICIFSFGAFFVFKNMTDSIMFDYFSLKENEWNQKLLKRSDEITFMRDRKKIIDKGKDK
jgi:hypothetical protein